MERTGLYMKSILPVNRRNVDELWLKKKLSNSMNINEIIYFRVLNIPVIFAQI